MDTKKYGSWTVIGQQGRYRIVRCKCGFIGKVSPYDLKNGKTRGCRPCSDKARIGKGNPKIVVHGHSDTPTQWVWSDMKRRCLSPHRRGYENYGGRGIKVCKRWMTFANFLKDMGPRPSSDHQIDRIDNDGDYKPGNCRWILRADQNYNKRNTFRFSLDGKTYNLEQAEKEFGVHRSKIWHRIVINKMTPEKAVRL